jgi:hypothetical protein
VPLTTAAKAMEVREATPGSIVYSGKEKIITLNV